MADGSKRKLQVYFNVHLVSDATGETLNAVMRAACAQFENVMPLEHNYYLVRSPRQLDRVLQEIDSAPGIVWFTISDDALRTKLENHCRSKGHPVLPILDSSVNMLSRHLGLPASERTAAQHSLNEEYFERMEAINYTLAHDDGAGTDNLRNADVILVGVSRTSKTPTCVYLANRGVKAANVPLVPGVPPPKQLLELDGKRPLVVALKVSPDRLVQIRQQRLLSLNETALSSYADDDQVKAEIAKANRLFAQQKWRTLDVSRRSVEETAAAILNLLREES
ncbi:pyruvate, water dikinase regulatory protein [Ponticaulis profundi]|uniref:Putative pyruvate, phosphate dikinase regulatory protein n=1 Tax=Ponticaulis profundi TaxID=2665222 RepID=A0ABW1S8S4_9PROT